MEAELFPEDKKQMMRLLFIDQMEDKIKEGVKGILNDTKKLDKKKAGFLKVKTVPRGIFSAVDEKPKFKPGEASGFISGSTGKHHPKNYWRRFIEENFDTIVSNSRNSGVSPQPLDYIMISFSDLDDLSSESAASLWFRFSAMEVDAQTSNVEQVAIQEQGQDQAQHVLQEQVADPEEVGEPSYATFTVSLANILRDDLPNKAKQLFFEKINTALIDISDFTSNLQFLTFLLMSSFRHYTFRKSNNHRVLVEECTERLDIIALFPENFVGSANIGLLAPSLSQQLLQSGAFCNMFGNFFTKKHLDFVYRSVFPSRGPAQDTRSALSLQESFYKAVISKNVLDNLSTEKLAAVPSALKDIAFKLFVTNFENMWKNRKIINRLLNKLLDVLLKIHLARIRETKYREMVEAEKQESKNKQKQKEETLKAHQHDIDYLSSDHRRLVIRGSHYKLNKYQKRLRRLLADTPRDETKIGNCCRQIELYDAKINTYTVKAQQRRQSLITRRTLRPNTQRQTPLVPTSSTRARKGKERETPHAAAFIPRTTASVVADTDDLLVMNEDILPEAEIIDEEDEQEIETGGYTKRRLNQLKGILKSTFFSSDITLNAKALKEKWTDLDEVEFNVCSSIYPHIKPYIPKKIHYTLPCYQIPFVLLANDVLHYAGYAKLAAEICPMPSTSLKGL
ncbi:hypothetical protein RMATCC62417_09560 [Rhizopus microsporus]|nr:hypothetical protein RMATCC62417_09560 [Rhizopus microsporus]